ncbi:LysR family transcriptional regulator [Cupriavidus sp. 30B13]|uniref:LysR family transcriptional regulator n=1 Tax=Cupriavidus sp. 30B13 TaxID=3384241 RepID=UPI003B908337
MQKRSLHWDDLLTLSTLIRTGNYSACARELGVTHATAIRRVRRLESALGKPVATRTDGAFALSAAGRAALAAAQQMENSAERLLRAVEDTGAGVSGVVGIACTAALGSHFLTPRLPALYRAHPQLEVRLETGNRVASLARRRAHVAVRLGRPQESDVIAQRAGSMGFGLYAPARPPGSGPWPAEELAAAPLCGLLDEGLALPESEWTRRAGARTGFQSNNMLAVHEAVCGGLGIGLLPHHLARGDARLVQVRDVPEVVREIWLAYPRELRGASRFRPVIDWLARTLAQCP